MNKKIMFFFLLLFGIVNFPSFLNYHYNYQGEKYYIKEDYEKAKQYFLKTNSKNGKYNIGILYYKNKDYKNSITTFQSLGNETGELGFRTNHNLGNSFYRYGKENEETKLENYLNAVLHYEKALEIKYDEETEKNKNFVLEKIKELENQETQNQENNSEQQQDENNNGENSEENNQEENGEENESGEGENEGEKSEGNENEGEKNNNSSSNGGQEESYELTEGQKQELEKYQEILKNEQNQYSEGFNKIYEEQYDDFFDSFFFNPMFDNSILNDNNKKDW